MAAGGLYLPADTKLVMPINTAIHETRLARKAIGRESSRVQFGNELNLNIGYIVTDQQKQR